MTKPSKEKDLNQSNDKTTYTKKTNKLPKKTGGVIGKLYDQNKKNQFEWSVKKHDNQYIPYKESINRKNSVPKEEIFDIEFENNISPQRPSSVQRMYSSPQSLNKSITLSGIFKERFDILNQIVKKIEEYEHAAQNFRGNYERREHDLNKCQFMRNTMREIQENIKRLEDNYKDTLELMTINGGFFKNPLKRFFNKTQKTKNMDSAVDFKHFNKVSINFRTNLYNLIKDTELFYHKLLSGEDDGFFDQNVKKLNESIYLLLPKLEDFRIKLLHFAASKFLWKIGFVNWTKQKGYFTDCFLWDNISELFKTNFSLKNFAGWTPKNKQELASDYGISGGSNRKQDCPFGKIQNPITHRYISINGKMYKNLVKQGVLQPVSQQKKYKEGSDTNHLTKTKKLVK
jgi:hypothetical protein